MGFFFFFFHLKKEENGLIPRNFLSNLREETHLSPHLNFCFYIEVFQSTFAGILNCEATVITTVFRLPQETVQINKNVYRSTQLLNVLAQ